MKTRFGFVDDDIWHQDHVIVFLDSQLCCLELTSELSRMPPVPGGLHDLSLLALADPGMSNIFLMVSIPESFVWLHLKLPLSNQFIRKLCTVVSTPGLLSSQVREVVCFSRLVLQRR